MTGKRANWRHSKADRNFLSPRSLDAPPGPQADSGMNLLIFGLGYSGRAIAREALAAGYEVTATSRGGAAEEAGVSIIPFNRANGAIEAATHIIATAAP